MSYDCSNKPTGYFQWHRTHWRFGTSNLTVDQATAACQNEGTQLAVITSKLEEYWLRTQYLSKACLRNKRRLTH